MSISDEAVEAAVQSVIDALQSDETGWVLADAPNEVTIDVNAFDLASALRLALEAAAPYILAQGWDGVATYIRNDAEIDQRIYVMKRIKAANPYRSQA